MTDSFGADEQGRRDDKGPGRRDRRVIAIRGAREHNLKNIDLDIPRDRLVVFTGLSGSGKSSLAFDTIYAEGQRRYVESLSAYARQFLEMMQKPDVDQIDGLSPAISIEQKTTSRNPRSTVGTVTEIHDYMRLLWARVGVPYSPATGLPIESQTVSQMVDRILALPEGTRLYLLAPVVRGRKGEYRKELADFMKKGFQRVKIDGAFYEIAEAPALDKKFTARHRRRGRPHRGAAGHRHAARGFARDRRSSSPTASRSRSSRTQPLPPPCGGGSAAARSGGGHAATRPHDAHAQPRPTRGGEQRTKLAAAAASDANRLIFSEKFACPVSGFTIPEIEPRLFSFNNPFGACPKCGGLGVEQHIDRRPGHSRQGAHLAHAAPSRRGRNRRSPYYVQTLQRARQALQASRSTPSGRTCRRRRRTRSSTAPARPRSASPTTTACAPTRPSGRSKASSPISSAASRETDSDWAREEIARYFTDVPCEACNGYRLKPEALCVKIGGTHIGEVSELSVKGAAHWFTELPAAAHRQAERDRRPHPQGDPRAAEIPGRRRARLSDAGARLRHAVGRREPAHPPRLADRLRPHRRALRARRAVDRPAPARQRAAARNAASACATSATP